MFEAVFEGKPVRFPLALFLLALTAACLPLGRSEPTATPTAVPTPTPLPQLPVITPTPAPPSLNRAVPTLTPAPVNAGATGRTYVVQPGDTLYSIAVRFGVPLQTLIDANGIEDPNHLQAGQVLIIPD